MDRLFCIIGKSGTGKDTLLTHLLADESLHLRPLVLYTTRPKRPTDVEGSTYHFVTRAELEEKLTFTELIEKRVYNTVHGDWIYATLRDDAFDQSGNVICVSTLESLMALKRSLGGGIVVPIYLEVSDYTRITRAINREAKQTVPSFSEVCRRYLADEKDFSPEALSACGVEKILTNEKLDLCLSEAKTYIKSHISTLLYNQ